MTCVVTAGVTYADCEVKWEQRYTGANKEHLEIGSRGINPFQAVGLRSYECV